jgi:hypothetical protein
MTAAAARLTTPEMIKLRPGKPPARREYVPKPADPGQRVTWSREISGHWTGASWGEGAWIPGHTVTRCGEIWSDGPYPRSSWVQPDDAPRGDMALIRYSTPREARWQASITEQHDRPPTWQHDAIRRAENVRRHGSIYATVDELREVWRAYGPRQTEEVLTWHCDPGCSQSAGKERRPGWTRNGGGWTLHAVVDVLTGRTEQRSAVPLCRECIYLSEPAAAVMTAGQAA